MGEIVNVEDRAHEEEGTESKHKASRECERSAIAENGRKNGVGSVEESGQRRKDRCANIDAIRNWCTLARSRMRGARFGEYKTVNTV